MMYCKLNGTRRKNKPPYRSKKKIGNKSSTMGRLGNRGNGGNQRRGETKWGKPKRGESSNGTRVGMSSHGNQGGEPRMGSTTN